MIYKQLTCSHFIIAVVYLGNVEKVWLRVGSTTLCISAHVHTYTHVHTLCISDVSILDQHFGGGDSRHFGPMCLLFLD